MSVRTSVVERYIEGFRRNDHAQVLSCLTDDVTWAIHGRATVEGRDAFDAAIDGDGVAGAPRLRLERLVEEGDTVMVTGAGDVTTDGKTVPFVFAESFTFRDDRVCRLDTYHLDLPGPAPATPAPAPAGGRAVRTYTAISLDGFVTGPDGRPVQLALPRFDPTATHGFPEFLARCGAVAMGRTTFEPALANPSWPWPGRRVYVLSSRDLPAGTPDHVVHVRGGPESLAGRLRDDDIDGDVHVVGGPTLIRGLWEVDGLDEVGLLTVPLLVGSGLRLFPLGEDGDLSGLRLVRHRAHPDGSVETAYARP